jgi:hypothetical protein
MVFFVYPHLEQFFLSNWGCSLCGYTWQRQCYRLFVPPLKFFKMAVKFFRVCINNYLNFWGRSFLAIVTITECSMVFPTAVGLGFDLVVSIFQHRTYPIYCSLTSMQDGKKSMPVKYCTARTTHTLVRTKLTKQPSNLITNNWPSLVTNLMKLMCRYKAWPSIWLIKYHTRSTH